MEELITVISGAGGAGPPFVRRDLPGATRLRLPYPSRFQAVTKLNVEHRRWNKNRAQPRRGGKARHGSAGKPEVG
jgi:hypothetical protein